MKTKNKIMCSRILVALMLTMLLLPLVTAPAMASTYQTAEGWRELANKLRPFRDIEDMGRRMSALAGGAQVVDTSKGGRMYVVIVVAGSKYYVNGKEIASLAGSDGDSELGDISRYDKYEGIAGGAGTVAGGSLKVDVYVHTDAGSKELQTINSNISAGLLSQAGVQPDTGTAMGLLSGIMPMINTLLGLIVTVISIGMTVFSALDIIYLAFPAFRDKIDSQVESGGKGSKTKKDGSTGSRWVSDDAMQAVKETQENQQQPWGAYFKKRVVAYVFLAVILFILLTGNIFAITTIVTNALSGLFETLGLQ